VKHIGRGESDSGPTHPVGGLNPSEIRGLKDLSRVWSLYSKSMVEKVV
jgi:hypothetical protein